MMETDLFLIIVSFKSIFYGYMFDSMQTSSSTSGVNISSWTAGVKMYKVF